MRTIEEKIIETLNGCNGEGVKKLSCRDCVEVNGGTKKYYLWDSLLFWNDSENIYHFSARGYNSKTTKSRLNALLRNFFNASITQKNYEWALNWNGKNILLIRILSLCLRIINFTVWDHRKRK